MTFSIDNLTLYKVLSRCDIFLISWGIGWTGILVFLLSCTILSTFLRWCNITLYHFHPPFGYCLSFFLKIFEFWLKIILMSHDFHFAFFLPVNNQGSSEDGKAPWQGVCNSTLVILWIVLNFLSVLLSFYLAWNLYFMKFPVYCSILKKVEGEFWILSCPNSSCLYLKIQVAKINLYLHCRWETGAEASGLYFRIALHTQTRHILCRWARVNFNMLAALSCTLLCALYPIFLFISPVGVFWSPILFTWCYIFQ